MTQNTEKMSLAEFEQRLPEFFATGTGKISDDPRFQAFLKENPDSAALVRDLEYIAAAAGELLNRDDIEPSDSVWQNIQQGLQQDSHHDAHDGAQNPPAKVEGLAAKGTE